MNRNLPDTENEFVMEGGYCERRFQAEKSMLAREEVMSMHDAFKKLSHPVA